MYSEDIPEAARGKVPPVAIQISFTFTASLLNKHSETRIFYEKRL
jgi:hypothetical protein